MLPIDVSTTLKTNYSSETMIPFNISGCREKIYSELAVVAKQQRLIPVRNKGQVPSNPDTKYNLRLILNII